MECVKLKTAIVLVIVYFACETWGELTISGVRCGSKMCRMQEYCSDFDRQCQPCSDVCNKAHHNYQESICEKNCQDYLHDIRYVRKDGGGGASGKDEDLRAVVQRLQYIVTVTLTLTCLTLLVVIIIITFQICKWKRNNHITLSSLRSKFSSKKSNDNKATGNGVTVAGQVSGKPDLRLDMPTTAGSQSENSPATITTIISRRPAEDSADDYAYDNHAMSSSPSPNSKPQESNF